MSFKKIYAFLTALCGLFLICGCSEKTLTRSNLAFDTIATVTIYKGGREELLDEAFETIKDLDGRLNAFNAESEISGIGTKEKVLSEDVYTLLEKNTEFSELAPDAFSPALGRLIELWNINEPETREPPSPEEVLEALSHSGSNFIELNPENKSVRLTEEGVKVNLGASAKGFAADKIKEELKEEGVSSAIINLGGNVLLVGDKDGGDFTVGIENPENSEDTPLGTLKLKDKSVVTSGSYQRYFTGPDGNVYHHLLDPVTGYPAQNDLNEVVVVSDSSLEGDMLSTALFVMGSEKGEAFIAKNYPENPPGVIFVTKNHDILVSENLKEAFSLEPGYEKTYKVSYF